MYVVHVHVCVVYIMCVCVCVCVCGARVCSACVCVGVRACVHWCVCVGACLCACMCAHACLHVCACVSVSMFVSDHVCLCESVLCVPQVYLHVYIFKCVSVSQENSRCIFWANEHPKSIFIMSLANFQHLQNFHGLGKNTGMQPLLQLTQTESKNKAVTDSSCLFPSFFLLGARGRQVQN